RQRQGSPRGTARHQPEGRARRAGRQSQILRDLRRVLHLQYAAGTDAGADALTKGGNIEAAKKALAESGYDGTPIVIMAPGDVVTLKAQPIVVAQQLRQAGFKVDLQATDWQTVVSRRTSQKPTSEGGWNMFFTNWAAADVMNPVVNFSIGGRGKNGGWFGWAEDPK